MIFVNARVDADTRGLRVRNVLGRHEVPWSTVRAVRFDPGAAWASVLLTNDDELALLAVQSVDRMHAVRAVVVDRHAPSLPESAARGLPRRRVQP